MLLKPHPKTIVALVLLLGAIAAPAANAMLPPADPPCPSCFSAFSPGGSRATSGSHSRGQHVSTAAIVRVDSKNGFDWGDAGIGAAGVVAIALVTLGLILVARSSRAAPAGRARAKSRATGV